VYNGEQYLRSAIDSVLSQSFRDFELLALDDGSTDSTPDILVEYARHDLRVRVLRHENRGVGYTLNRGIHEARGSLIAELGADDIALPGRIEKQVAFLNANPDYVFVGGQLRIIDSHDKSIGLRKYPIGDEELRARMLLYNPFGSPSLMYRRGDAIAVGGYTSRFGTSEDYDLLFRLAKRGKIANLPQPLTAYRFHSASTKSQRTLRTLRDTVAIKRTAFAEYGYRATLPARAVNIAQDALTRLPAGVAYWLFTKLFIRSERAR
jgi:glycosyltransferase involved in cell wall biosynthesis